MKTKIIKSAGSVTTSRHVISWHDACFGARTRDVALKIKDLLNEFSNKGILEDGFKATIEITPSMFEPALDITVQVKE
jgi:hypothetical protein